jgi:hypothetical protein
LTADSSSFYGNTTKTLLLSRDQSDSASPVKMHNRTTIGGAEECLKRGAYVKTTNIVDQSRRKHEKIVKAIDKKISDEKEKLRLGYVVNHPLY